MRIRIAAVLAVTLCASSFAQVPSLINYQGRLLDGTNLVNGVIGLTLSLYDDPAAGNLLYEDSNFVAVVDGLYSTYLGDDTVKGSLSAALTNATVYIEVAVNGAELSPRERMVAVGYASLAADVPGNVFWRATGNTGTSANTHFVGVRDNLPLNFRVNNQRALRLVPNADSPHVIGGHNANTASTISAGAVIGGGGSASEPNEITAVAAYSAIGGGRGNRAGDNSVFTLSGTIAGGYSNLVISEDATVGGGRENTAYGLHATVAGGYRNLAYGYCATVAGGERNLASNSCAFVAGGSRNKAEGDNSLAAGRFAEAIHDGTFVWADRSIAGSFQSTRSNQFLIRAAGGVGINTETPATGALTVAGTVVADAFTGNGAGLTALNGGALTDGTVSNAELAATAVTGNKIVDGTISNADVAVNTFWETDGNAGTAPATHFVGTTDGQPLLFRANNQAALRLDGSGSSPNLVGGHAANTVDVSVVGATIAGGGAAGIDVNRVTDDHGAVGGGAGNRAGDSGGTKADAAYATVAGGARNAADGLYATIGGGTANRIGRNGEASVIGGGASNVADRTGSVVAGGIQNAASLPCSFVGGGQRNTASNFNAVICGGNDNTNLASAGFIGGGTHNAASSNYAVIVGGYYNNIRGASLASILGGLLNNIAPGASYAAIAGGAHNGAGSAGAFVGGGISNLAQGSITFVGGGASNTARAARAAVAGGSENAAEANASFIGGGYAHTTTGDYSVIAGGYGNLVGSGGDYSVIAGGRYGEIHSTHAVLAGGDDNYVGTLANYSAIAGGLGNILTNYAHGTFIGAGYHNVSSGRWAVIGGGQWNSAGEDFAVVGGGATNAALGEYSVVPGGALNTASGRYAFAAGYRAKAMHEGAFVWADSQNADFSSTKPDQLAIRATNGVWIARNNRGGRVADFGERYRDNGIVAWARITSAGNLSDNYNVTGCVRSATGAYRIYIGADAESVTALIPMAVAEVDTQPNSAASVRIISVNQTLENNQFDVWINDGTFAAVNEDFLFMVTGR